MRNPDNFEYICGVTGIAVIVDFQNGRHKIHIWPFFCL